MGWFTLSFAMCLIFTGIASAGVGIGVSSNSWDVTGSQGASSGTWISNGFSASNIGDTRMSIKIRATNTQNWNLGTSPGLDTFAIQQGMSPNWNGVSTTDSDMTTLSAGTSHYFNIRFQSPTDVSDKTLHTTQVSTMTLSASTALQPPPTSYTFVRIFGGGSGSGDGQFNEAKGLKVDGSGNIYVADLYNGRIQKFSSNGTFLTKWSLPSPDGRPMDVAIDPTNTYAYTASFYGYDSKFSVNGVYQSATNIGGNCYGVVVDPQGNIYTCISTNKIRKYSPTWQLLTEWGNEGQGNGQFMCPVAICMDKDGYIYVIDQGTSRVQKFTSAGQFIKSWLRPSKGPWEDHMAVDAFNRIHITDSSSANSVQIYTADGTLITTSGVPGLNFPQGIDFDAAGNMYVSERYRNDVRVYAPKY